MSKRSYAFVTMLAIALAFALAVPLAEACGGPSFADLGALEKIDGTLDWMETPDPYWDPTTRDELRFLYPFYREHPAELESLWSLSYKGDGSVPDPSLDALDAAIEKGDLDAADHEARAVIDALLDLPPAIASKHTEALWRAVEIVEVLPKLRGEPKSFVRGVLNGPMPVSPMRPLVAEMIEARRATPGSTGAIPTFSASHARAASFELWSMQRDFRSQVPDGYADALQKSVAPAAWAAFEHRADLWRAAHPNHPLADYVLLWKEHVRYFEGDIPGAWRVLFDVYSRHMPRALAEMRYLLLQGKPPTSKQIDALTDPLLIAGLASEKSITPKRFTAWWKLAETEPARPWSMNLEERLLFWAARNAKPNALPQGFPTEARNPTPLWGKLRAAALAKSGDLAGARAELRSVAADAEQARLAAQVEIASKRPAAAAALPELGDDARTYLLRVRVNDAELARMAKSTGPAAKPARFEIAVRLIGKGEWKSAAQGIEKDDPERAKLWRQAATLAAKSGASGARALARFLEENQEKILYPTDPGFYRAVSSRYDPAHDRGEATRIEAALTRGTARWLSLEAYARALEAHPHAAEAREAIAEADHGYNRLINWAGGGGFWSTYATKTPAVAVIRGAGKAVRRGGGK